MKTTVLCDCIRSWGVLIALVACVALSPVVAWGQSSSFSYQGSLSEGGGLADGMYDLEFGLYSALTGGSELATSESLGVQVLDGLFTTVVDFDSDQLEFGLDWYMEIRVRPEGEASYTALNPRVALGVIPNAVHAEVAEVAQRALTGPFEPVDTAPRSSSGFRNQFQTYELTVDGRRDTNVEVRFPIVITREVITDQFQFRAGRYSSFEIEIERAVSPNDDWRDYVRDHEIDARVDIVTHTPSNDSTEFSFIEGFVIGHRIEVDEDSGGFNQSLVEVLTLSFGRPLGGPIGQDRIGDIVTRNAAGLNDREPGISPPSLGGFNAPSPDRFTYSFLGYTPIESNVGALPDETHNTDQYSGQIVGLSVPSPLTLLHHVFVDSSNIMWDNFANRDTHNGELALLDGNQVIWEPIHNAQTISVISGWTLDRADDGGLFETYQIEYQGETFNP